MRRLLPMALLAAAVFGTDAEAAVRVYRPSETAQVAIAAVAVPLIWWLFSRLRSEQVGAPLASVSVACMAAVWVGSRLAG